MVQNDECNSVKQEKTVWIAINEPNTVENRADEIDVEIVSVAQHDKEYLPHQTKEHKTRNEDFILIDFLIYSSQQSSFSDLTCNTTFDDTQLGEKKLETCDQPHDREFKCIVCSKEFHTKKNFLDHTDFHNEQATKRKLELSIFYILLHCNN